MLTWGRHRLPEEAKADLAGELGEQPLLEAALLSVVVIAVVLQTRAGEGGSATPPALARVCARV